MKVINTWNDGADTFRMDTLVELGYIRGNAAPHFAVAADIYRNGRWDSGGCQHEEVLAKNPELADVVALHLSDIDGAPLHAMENGWYWMTGILDLPASYKPTNGSFPKTAEECGQILKSHLRIDDPELDAMRRDCLLSYKMALANPEQTGAYALAGDHGERAGYADGMSPMAEAKRVFGVYVALLHGRWKAEADAVIAKYNLTVTDDHWVRPGAATTQGEAP